MISYSKHFLQQIEARQISLAAIENALNAPDYTLVEDDLTVYQKKLMENDKLYWLRIFVNNDKQPPLAVTGL